MSNIFIILINLYYTVHSYNHYYTFFIKKNSSWRLYNILHISRSWNFFILLNNIYQKDIYILSDINNIFIFLVKTNLCYTNKKEWKKTDINIKLYCSSYIIKVYDCFLDKFIIYRNTLTISKDFINNTCRSIL